MNGEPMTPERLADIRRWAEGRGAAHVDAILDELDRRGRVIAFLRRVTDGVAAALDRALGARPQDESESGLAGDVDLLAARGREAAYAAVQLALVHRGRYRALRAAVLEFADRLEDPTDLAVLVVVDAHPGERERLAAALRSVVGSVGAPTPSGTGSNLGELEGGTDA